MDLLFFIFIFTFIATAYINLTNFMDGLDGLVSGCLLIILISFIFYSNLNLLPIVASLFAFLIFNWSPAKIFMGDTGSTFLGLLFFNLTFNSGDIYIFLAFALINTPLFGDSAICILKDLLMDKIYLNLINFISIKECIQQGGINLSLHFYI